MLPLRSAPHQDYLPLRLCCSRSSSHSHAGGVGTFQAHRSADSSIFGLFREAPAPPRSHPSSSHLFFLFFFFFANRHPTTAYPEERSRGGEREDTPAYTVPAVRGEDAVDNMMRWLSSTVPYWKIHVFWTPSLHEARRPECRSCVFTSLITAGALTHSCNEEDVSRYVWN